MLRFGSNEAKAKRSIKTMIYNCSHFNPVNIGSSTEQFVFASSTCEIENATSSVPSIFNGFTYGEVVSSFFLFLIFLGIFAMLFIKLIFKKNL